MSLTTPQCPSQPRFQDLDPRFANMCACPIMLLHMHEHVILFVLFLQQLLKMHVDPLEPILSIGLNLLLDRCHLGWASTSSLSVLTDVL